MQSDLRDWIQKVEELGELRHVHGAHWNLEVGALMELARQETRTRPALLFDQIVDYPEGYRILTGIGNSRRRVALTLGLPPDLAERDLVLELRRLLQRVQPIPPRLVDSGPVMENVMTGDDVNLWQFPVPKWHELDGGRYLGTATAVVTRDPDDGGINLGTYRNMVINANTLGFHISPGKHGRIHREKYFERGEPCPVAISYGHHPLLFFVSTMHLPYNLDEYAFAGGIQGEPVDVIRGPYTGLPIPANSELVIEGESYPDQTLPEGPFGEFPGYYASGEEQKPFIRVKSVLYRSNPIILGCPPGRPPGEDTYFYSRVKAALVWEGLEKAGVPDVQGVCSHEIGAGHFLLVVAIKQRYPGHARQAGHVATQVTGGAYMGRFTIVVDEDINPYDLDQVLWAMCTRCDPVKSIDIVRRCWSGPLDPALAPEDHGLTSRAIIDACRPYERIKDFAPVIDISPELRQRIWQRFEHVLKDA